jgi:hypothetical protein
MDDSQLHACLRKKKKVCCLFCFVLFFLHGGPTTTQSTSLRMLSRLSLGFFLFIKCVKYVYRDDKTRYDTNKIDMYPKKTVLLHSMKLYHGCDKNRLC